MTTWTAITLDDGTVGGIPVTCPHCGNPPTWADTSEQRGPCRVLHRLACTCGWDGFLRCELVAIRTPITPDRRARAYRHARKATA